MNVKGSRYLPVAFMLPVLSILARGSDEMLTGVESWAWRKGWPAQVNPVVSSPLQEVISLRGEWDFATTPQMRPLRHPTWDAFYKKADWPGLRKINVPGCWEAQGVGEPGLSDTWDTKWDHCAKPLRHIYMGTAWYRKKIEVPGAWQGKRVWLKVGGVRAQGWVWVNDRTVAWIDNYCGSYKYDITDLVKPGEEAKIVIAVNNALPSRKGQSAAHHRFGGLYRDVELEATPVTRIDDAWVRGDFDKREAEIHASIVNAAAASQLQAPLLKVRILETAAVNQTPVVFEAGKNMAEVVVRLPLDPFQPWSPETPSLYVAEITLCDGDQPVHGWVERFGVRKIEVRGERFFLNDKPFFVRGFGDDYVYPLTLCSPASREEHLRHMLTARAAGFNYVRKHTHTDMPEYYEAADEAGIMIQPELPYYGDYPVESFTFDPVRDITELYRHYRRYTSFTTYCTGNEGLLGSPLDEHLYRYVKRMDPDRLMIHQDGTLNKAGNSDFRNGPITIWRPGSFECDAPFVAHEYMNLSVKQDPRLEEQFSGAMLPPATLAERDKRLQAAGLDRRWGDACQDASHALQAYYQKLGIESARLDPACDGYSFWTIVDVIVQQGGTYSAQGLFDPFWRTKRNGASPAAFKLFNDETALLLNNPSENRILSCGAAFAADLWIAHYGTAPLKATQLQWTLKSGETALAQGLLPPFDVALGETVSLGTLTCTVPAADKPMRATLEARLAGTEILNRWEFWIFPVRAPREVGGLAISASLEPLLGKHFRVSSTPKEAQILIAQPGDEEIMPILEAGGRVLSIGRADGKPNVSLGWWSMGSQVGTAIADHPALGDFPHSGHLSPLLFRIMKKGAQLPLEGFHPDDMLIVGEGRDHYYLYAAEARLGKGRLLQTFGLDLVSGTAEGLCLLDNLVDRVRSEAFNPKGELKSLGRGVSGWRRTLKTGDVGYQDLPWGASHLDVARGLAGHNELIWETRPAPENVHDDSRYAVSWQGGMGYFAEPNASFDLYINDEKAISISEISRTDKTWMSEDNAYVLEYVRDKSSDEYGLMTLLMPSYKVKPGQALQLKVLGSDSDSRRWFGVFGNW